MKSVDKIHSWLNAVVKTKIGVRNFILKKAGDIQLMKTTDNGIYIELFVAKFGLIKLEASPAIENGKECWNWSLIQTAEEAGLMDCSFMTEEAVAKRKAVMMPAPQIVH